jgi:hypothetical protein
MRASNWPPRKTGRVCVDCKHDIETGGKQFECNECSCFPLCVICNEKHNIEGVHLDRGEGDFDL